MPQTESTALDAASKSDRALPIPTAATRDVAIDRSGGGTEKPRPPLICELLELAQFVHLGPGVLMRVDIKKRPHD
jgi:hypothetical protein